MHGRSDGFLHRLAVLMNVSFRPEGTANTQRAREGGARAAWGSAWRTHRFAKM